MGAGVRSRRPIRLVLVVVVALMLAGVAAAREQQAPAASAQGQSTTSEMPAMQQSGMAQPSLGDLARQQRRADQALGKSPKVFTNENLPAAATSLTILGSPENHGGVDAAPDKTDRARSEHSQEYYESRARELRGSLDLHQRELEVLQQELGENQVQYYADPSKALHQEYSRQDINRVRESIDRKQEEVNRDQQALSGLEDELRRNGGEPGWLEGEPSAARAGNQRDLAGVEKGSEQYWRRRFSAAREALARASEERQLAEDELRLLQSQQAHDWGTGADTSADPKITDKQTEVQSKRAAEAQAQQELDALENEFQQSGAPEDWSKPDPGNPDRPVPPQKPGG